MKFALTALLIAGVMLMPARAQVTYSYSATHLPQFWIARGLTTFQGSSPPL